jgi:hypothetical protein
MKIYSAAEVSMSLSKSKVRKVKTRLATAMQAPRGRGSIAQIR